MEEARIRVLSDEVVNLIAAGEVVERPASVVRELAENSVDAGAGMVSVRVEEAGLRKISIEDDGFGMSRVDAVLAFKRHATSKISTSSDLDSIHTLGFRGEALPSIASVSDISIVTRPSSSQLATAMTVEAGVVTKCGESGAPEGTLIEVSDLFHNVPARRKFLKSQATELRNVVEAVQNLALIHENVGFELLSEGRSLLSFPRACPLGERAAKVAGVGVEDLFFHSVAGPLGRLVFAFAAPHESRGHRKSIRFFVNRRSVNDRILAKALSEGYRGLLEHGRFPVAMLWLEISPEEVDVNVHPAKREVRFRDEGGIFRFVAACVAEGLSKAPWVRADESRGGGSPSVGEVAGYGLAGEGEGYGGRTRVAEALDEYAARALSGGVARTGFSTGGFRGSSFKGYGAALNFNERSSHVEGKESDRLTGDEMASPFGPLKFLGACDSTYLVFQTEDNKLIIIDQHAAHERILFEKLMESGRRVAGEQLLVPIVIDVGAAEMAALGERAQILESVGIIAEPFGQRSISINRVPAGVTALEAEAMARDALGGEIFDAHGGVEERRKELCERLACKGAVKARMALHHSEVRQLLRDLSLAKNPSHCPHGRPLVLRLGRPQLESLFHRR